MSSSSQHRANAGQQDGSTHSYGENAVSKLVAAGNAAYVDEDYSGAVDSYTAALEVPGLPACAAAEVYALRAQAHTQREDYVNGVADANRAVELNPKLQKAYLRKVSRSPLACFVAVLCCQTFPVSELCRDGS
jgi:tetratricopeptide (TPR) repeat protein